MDNNFSPALTEWAAKQGHDLNSANFQGWLKQISTCKPTISDIKHYTQYSNPHFLSPSAMRAFGQCMSDFKIYKTDVKGIWRVVAKRKHGYTVRYFNIVTFELTTLYPQTPTV